MLAGRAITSRKNGTPGTATMTIGTVG